MDYVRVYPYAMYGIVFLKIEHVNRGPIIYLVPRVKEESNGTRIM